MVIGLVLVEYSSSIGLGLQRQIHEVVSPPIFKQTIATVLDYLKLHFNPNSVNPLTVNHFNNNINDNKFSNLLSFIQFENANATHYKNVFKMNSELVRSQSTRQDTPLKKLNIFQSILILRNCLMIRNYSKIIIF